MAKSKPTLTISPSSFPKGVQTLAIAGSGYDRRQNLQILTSRKSIWVTCDAEGAFTAEWEDDFNYSETAHIAATDDRLRILAMAEYTVT